MWSVAPSREKILGLKTVQVAGMRAIIRRIAIHDFEPGLAPGFLVGREVDPKSWDDLDFLVGECKRILEAGMVEPKMAKKGQPGITADDLFRDIELAFGLALEIVLNNLTRPGLNGFIQRIFMWPLARLALKRFVTRSIMAEAPRG